jgi:hypothetical protein
MPLTLEQRNNSQAAQGTSMQLCQAESLNPGPSVIWRYAIRNTSREFREAKAKKFRQKDETKKPAYDLHQPPPNDDALCSAYLIVESWNAVHWRKKLIVHVEALDA